MSRRPSAQTKSRSSTNRLRIIGGQWRGRKLAFADLPGLRPTPDRVRETLFNWLSTSLWGARCLDLFAGSGALGFEALSRGAEHTTFVDLAPAAVGHIQSNLKLLNCSSAEVIQSDSRAWMQAQQPTARPFDIIFMDPPFYQDMISECCRLIQQQGLLKPGGYLYIESETSATLAPAEPLYLHRQTRAGQVAGYLFRSETKDN